MRKWRKEEIEWLLSNMEKIIKEGNTPGAAATILQPEFKKQCGRNISDNRMYQLYLKHRKAMNDNIIEEARLIGYKIFVMRVTDKLAMPCNSMAEALRLVQGDVSQWVFFKGKPLIVEHKRITVVKDVEA